NTRYTGRTSRSSRYSVPSFNIKVKFGAGSRFDPDVVAMVESVAGTVVDDPAGAASGAAVVGSSDTVVSGSPPPHPTMITATRRRSRARMGCTLFGSAGHGDGRPHEFTV